MNLADPGEFATTYGVRAELFSSISHGRNHTVSEKHLELQWHLCASRSLPMSALDLPTLFCRARYRRPAGRVCAVNFMSP